MMGTITVGPKPSKMGILDDNYRSFEERQKELEAMDRKDEQEIERERQSRYKNWYQFNRQHSKEMIWLAREHPMAQTILLFLLDQMNEFNAVMCSYRVIQEALAMSQVTVARSVKVLKEHGFVMVAKSGTANIYHVNDDLAWSSWSTNRKYSKFPANIIISAGENAEYLERIDKTKIKQLSMIDGENG